MGGVRRVSILVLAALTLGACGSSDSRTSTTAATGSTSSTSTKAPKVAEPSGKLSPSEYRAVRAVVMRTAKLEHVKSLAHAVRVTKAACRVLSVQTELVIRMKSACVQSGRTLAAIHGLELHKGECTRALNAGDVSCYSNLFRTIGRAARVSVVRERAMNSEIRHRRLHGRCAKPLVSTDADLKNAGAIAHDAISAANAAERRDGEGFTRATNRLQQDIEADTGGGSAKQALRKLKACV
jgi:hypothetical protein